jgi:hypothetical protein
MTQPGETVSKRAVSMQLRPATVERLDQLAADAGLPRATVAALLLEELLPSVTGVRMRLQVTRTGNGGAPAR